MQCVQRLICGGKLHRLDTILSVCYIARDRVFYGQELFHKRKNCWSCWWGRYLDGRIREAWWSWGKWICRGQWRDLSCKPFQINQVRQTYSQMALVMFDTLKTTLPCHLKTTLDALKTTRPHTNTHCSRFRQTFWIKMRSLNLKPPWYTQIYFFKIPTFLLSFENFKTPWCSVFFVFWAAKNL